MSNNERLAEVRRLLCAEASVKNWALLMLHHQQAHEAKDQQTIDLLKERFSTRYYWTKGNYSTAENTKINGYLCISLGYFRGDGRDKWNVYEVIDSVKTFQICSMQQIGAKSIYADSEKIDWARNKQSSKGKKWEVHFPSVESTEEKWGAFLNHAQDVTETRFASPDNLFQGLGPQLISVIQDVRYLAEQARGGSVSIRRDSDSQFSLVCGSFGNSLLSFSLTELSNAGAHQAIEQRVLNVRPLPSQTTVESTQSPERR